jgi:hypothetical protein
MIESIVVIALGYALYVFLPIALSGLLTPRRQP